MTLMTASKMEDRIDSKEWTSVDTLRVGSEDYMDKIGLMRIMFEIQGDPLTIIILQSDLESEVWVQNSDESWEQVF